MKHYIATFHTHLSAMMTAKNLKKENISSSFEPVPRKLSSSCGTCIRFTAGDAYIHLMDRDCEAVYEVVEIKNNKEDYIKIADIS